MVIAVNGTLVDEGVAKRLEASGIKRVSLSIDAGTEPVTTSFAVSTGPSGP